MKRSQPLYVTNPEFSILEFPGFCEYRVENWRLSRDGSSKVIRGTSVLTWLDVFLAVAIAILWRRIRHSALAFAAIGVLSLHVWFKCNQVLSESVIVLPPHGIQLETHRGLPSLCLAVTRRFIPLELLQDVVINEGLRRWDIRYYLAAITQVGPESFALDVAYENLLPHHRVLLQVYRGVHDLLLKTRQSCPSNMPPIT